MTQQTNPIRKKFELSQAVASECFGINNIEDLEAMLILIKQQKELANKLFWAKANANTGKTALETQERMVENEKLIKKRISQMSLEELGI